VKRVFLDAYCTALSDASTCALVAFWCHWSGLIVLVSYVATGANPPVMVVSQVLVGRRLEGGVSTGNIISGDGVVATLGGDTPFRTVLGGGVIAAATLRGCTTLGDTLRGGTTLGVVLGITIGNGTWVGMTSGMMCGTTLGSGTVVGMTL
jgi:hypothetical protein